MSHGRIRRGVALRRSRAAGDHLREIAESGRPIVVGPWVGGVGAELLYWIPVLNWLTTELEVDPDRIVAVSRAGADPWYSEVAGQYIDLLDHIGTRRLAAAGKDALHELDPPRPIERSKLDRLAFRIATRAARFTDAAWLHPSLIWPLFRPRWYSGAGASIVAAHTLQRPLPEDPFPSLAREGPYVTLKAYFCASFPPTDENHALLMRLIEELAARAEVLLLDASPEDGRVTPFEPPRGTPVRRVTEMMSPRTSLLVQSSIIRHGEILVAPYGGFSFLGPYLSTPTVAFYSHAGFDRSHLDAIDRVGRQLAGSRESLFRARHVGHLAPIRADLAVPEAATP